MNIFEIILLSTTICIDSFILCLLTKINKKRYYFLIPLIFTIFQCLFLYSGYFLGNLLETIIINNYQYIIFLIFSFMGLKLMIDTISNKGKDEIVLTSFSLVIIQAVSTSFDSLFLGMPLALNNIDQMFLITILGITTFTVCLIALLIRKKVNNKYDDIINIIGSIILFFFAFESLL